TRQSRLGNLLHCLNGLTGRVARSRYELNSSRGEQVISGDLVQPLLFLQLHEGRVGDHLPLFIPDEKVVQVTWHPPELWPSLNIDFVELVESNKTLLVRASNKNIEVV